MTLPKLAALGSLSEVVKASREAADNHSKQLHSFQRFADMVVRVIRKQAPDLLPAISHVIGPFTAAIAHENVLVSAAPRAADDLHDLSDRYEVLLRQWSEYTDISKRLRDAREKIVRLRRELEEEERKGGPKQSKLQNDITVTVEAKRRAVEEGQAKLEEILRSRERYYAFSARRLRHAYAHLGSTLAAESRAVVASFRDMQSRINELRENIDGILDGTYALPDVGPVAAIAVGEEEDAAEGASPPPPRRAPDAAETPDEVEERPEEPPSAKRGGVADGEMDIEALPLPEAEATPYEPAPYAPFDDESPFPPD
jgi:hypothetical protein